MTSYAMPRPNPLAKVVLVLIGSPHGSVELDETTLRVRLGLGFQGEVPRSAITSAVRDTGREISIGAHGWRGRWLVNTSTRGLVRLTIEPPGKGRCLGIPVVLRELRVSLDDPDAFLRDLGATT
jgi:hypothetical protein